jgi:outer membrane lipoprotein-sorting protein
MLIRIWKAVSKRGRRQVVLLLLAIVSGRASADLLDDALMNYAKVETYQVTLRSSASAGRPFREIIRYAYKKPGWVRMDFRKPHNGLVLIYDPESNGVRLWPLDPKGPEFSLSPDAWLLKSGGGERVDRSDIGTMLQRAIRLREGGDAQVLGNEQVNHRDTVRLRVTGGAGEAVEGVHRFDLWLDARTLMPLRIEGYDIRDAPLDLVLMDDLQVDVPLQDRAFREP